jgi:hypothetical protein
MRSLRRAAIVAFAAVAAFGAALVFLPAAALIDPATRQASLRLAIAALAIATDWPNGGGIPAAVDFLWWILMLVSAFPILAAALIGEIARVRTLSWYVGATGFAAASMPWLLRTALQLPRAAADYNSIELRFAVIFFLAGLLSGLVYWLLAGHDAGDGGTP